MNLVLAVSTPYISHPEAGYTHRHTHTRKKDHDALSTQDWVSPDRRVIMVRLILFGCLLIMCVGVCGQDTIRFMTIVESQQPNIPTAFGRGLTAAQSNTKSKLDQDLVLFNEDNEDENLNSACQVLNRGVSVVVDLTWAGWYKVREIAKKNGVPYVRIETSIRPYVMVADQYLVKRGALDAALIFQDEIELDQSLRYLIGNSVIRVLLLNRLNPNKTDNLKQLRPSPSFHVIFGDTPSVTELFNFAVTSNMAGKNYRWILVFTDFRHHQFRLPRVKANITMVKMVRQLCCQILLTSPKDCDCNFNRVEEFSASSANFLAEVVDKMIGRGISFSLKTASCDVNISGASFDQNTHNFHKEIEETTQSRPGFWWDKNHTRLSYNAFMEISLTANRTEYRLGNWTYDTNIIYSPGIDDYQIRRKFRVGTNEIRPWAYVAKRIDGEDVWEGYCIDLLTELAKRLSFDYEMVIPADKQYGEKVNGEWNGLVGDLEKGETDIVIAALTMTSEREQVIDFVAPYFAQAGITIMTRRPIRNTSLFKFMTVLKLEVWLSILGALTVTGVMLWFLDKYSPYSAQNNKEAYPYPCREFTLKESFWFALTSFTPQGGGEAPKALSGRTLVAAYWLFVVLMLATFTANLAAFLTVERMQSPVQSLEQLARQSKINYTVVNGSWYHEYFINMAHAEEELYQMWKNLTLSSSEQSKFRVWDYPIKEQYTHILKVLEESEPAVNASEGFERVRNNKDGDFAFIHDSAEVRYMVYTNCEFTEVGETFAEQPYAIAVQQGSHLQEEISKVILDLQKDRYFEILTARYWNTTLKNDCASKYDSEGITLQSLGGVFIATLFGLALAMVTLAGEVFLRKKKQRKMRSEVTQVVPYKRSEPHQHKSDNFQPVNFIKFNSTAFHN